MFFTWPGTYLVYSFTEKVLGKPQTEFNVFLVLIPEQVVIKTIYKM